MIHKIFTIHDSAASAYLPLFMLHAEGMAIRAFQDCINDTNHQFHKHPADYSLMCIGEFDDTSGKITTLQTQKPLGNGLSFVVKPNSPNQLELVEEIAK